MKVAVIREVDCVGCAKCLPACPVDAIVGAAKFLHQVITDECIGCELCVAPCPMDCIEMRDLNTEHTQEHSPNDEYEDRRARATKAKMRYQAKQQRMLSERPLQLSFDAQDPKTQREIQQNVQAAYARVEKKRRDIRA